MLAKGLTLFIVAMTVAACGTSPKAPVVSVDAAALCRALGNELAGAKGATPRDQRKIDATLERMIGMGCLTREEAANERA